jgi:hypothetical protein
MQTMHKGQHGPKLALSKKKPAQYHLSKASLPSVNPETQPHKRDPAYQTQTMRTLDKSPPQQKRKSISPQKAVTNQRTATKQSWVDK